MLVLVRTKGTTAYIDDIILRVIEVRKNSVTVLYGTKELKKVILFPDSEIKLGEKGRILLRKIKGKQAHIGFDCPKHVSVIRDNAHKIRP